ncbi:MAG: type II toxin-antitoxin system VapB family antitoxin [Acidobacteria bacterium]|nr:type II toxin-antitoxin system VapB family antitoxin [Acidobacteriota bacterium]
MRSNLAINDRLLVQARRAGCHRTKGETVNAALAECVTRRKQLALLGLFGRIDFDPAYDYKRDRRAKRR